MAMLFEPYKSFHLNRLVFVSRPREPYLQAEMPGTPLEEGPEGKRNSGFRKKETLTGVAPPPEGYFAAQLDEYLEEAPEIQRKALQNPAMRKKVLRQLQEMKSLLPVVERMSMTGEAIADRLSLSQTIALKQQVLKDKLETACQLAALETENMELLTQNYSMGMQMEELKRMTKMDPLTQMPNLRAYDEEVVRSVELCRRNGVPVWCLMMDIDHFKNVNDDYGHPVGDQVLQEVAKRLQGGIRGSDFVARYGGEEFIALIHTREDGDGLSSSDEVKMAAHRLLLSIGQKPFLIQTQKGRKRLRITMSVGGSRFHIEGDEADDMKQRADNNLYMAKNSGRNRVYLEGEYVSQREVAGIPSKIKDEQPSRMHIGGRESA